MAPIDPQDEIVDLVGTSNSAKAKPAMRLDPEMLQGSVLARSLPGFLERMARANNELDLAGATAGFELTEEQAASQQHIAMDVYAGVIKKSKSRHRPQIKLPTHDGEPADDTSSDVDSESEVSHGEAKNDEHDTSSDESIASSSTEASQLASTKKRKAASIVDLDNPRTPSKKARVATGGSSPTLSTYSSSSGSSGSSIGNSRIIKIKVPSKSPSPDDSDSSALSASSNRKIIKLKDPRKTPPRSARQPTPTGIIKLKMPASSSSRGSDSIGDTDLVRPPSSGSDSSTPGKRLRIKVVSPPRQGKPQRNPDPSASKRRLVEVLDD